MISADEALTRLRKGNERFITGHTDATIDHTRRAELAASQAPFAIILGCSDSRVPAEIVFDQGLGDLFVIRVAGNIVAPSQIASVEFAAEQFGSPLVVVLGHTQCGAIAATLHHLEHPTGDTSPGLAPIVDRVRAAVEPLLRGDINPDRDAFVHEAVRANVAASVRQLKAGSEALERRVRSGALRILGGEYSLETGEVEYLDLA